MSSKFALDYGDRNNKAGKLPGKDGNNKTHAAAAIPCRRRGPQACAFLLRHERRRGFAGKSTSRFLRIVDGHGSDVLERASTAAAPLVLGAAANTTSVTGITTVASIGTVSAGSASESRNSN